MHIRSPLTRWPVNACRVLKRCINIVNQIIYYHACPAVNDICEALDLRYSAEYLRELRCVLVSAVLTLCGAHVHCEYRLWSTLNKEI